MDVPVSRLWELGYSLTCHGLMLRNLSLLGGAIVAAVALAAPVESQRAAPTGLIVGQVLDGVTRRPVAGAIVAISGGSAQGRPRILTRGDGRFVFPTLTAGRYSITATKDGYTEGSFGRMRPAGASRTLDLTADQRVGDAVVLLWKAAAISGTVVDEAGEAQVNSVVHAMRRTIVAGQRVFQRVGTARTDDRGVFRIGGLVPGDYVVGTVPLYAGFPAGAPVLGRTASSGATTIRLGDAYLPLDAGTPLAPSSEGHLMIYPPVYHPASTSSDAATVMALQPGQDYEEAALRITPVPSVPVSGRLIGPDGPVVGAQLKLYANGAPNLSLESDWLAAMTDQGGRFAFPAVPPGQYALRFARPNVTPTGGNSVERDVIWADLPVTVGKEPITEFVVVAQHGIRIRGQVEFDGAGDTAAALRQLFVSIEPVDPPGPGTIAPPSRPDSDGQFTGPGLAGGRYYVRVPNSPSGWMFLGATLEGRDVTDQPLDLSGDTQGLSIRFTDRWSGVNGTVLTRNAIDTTALVVVFPTDQALWGSSGANPRRSRSVQPNSLGGFSVNLPPGDYYVAAIPDDYAQDWRDPDFLAALSRVATSARIGTGEQRTLQLRRVALR